jgi:hypothetical protein
MSGRQSGAVKVEWISSGLQVLERSSTPPAANAVLEDTTLSASLWREVLVFDSMSLCP